jgi:DNA topoisomerase-1
VATQARPGLTSAVGSSRRDATAAGLRYVRPDDPGIRRRRAGRGFTYLDPNGRRVRSRATLDRLRAIAIPPAWVDVWICPRPEGHIQATGRDARGRLQYRYHPEFRARRDDGKFDRLIRFGERLPRIRRQVRQDLARRDLPREKVLAAVVSLLESTRLRVGGAEYARLNRSFGVSTLRQRHAEVTGSTIRFRFRGKGGRAEERRLVDRRLAAVVRRCQDLPGQALFQYETEDGETRGISSEDVNDYIREAAGSDELSAKDFRTWTATLHAFRALQEAVSEGAPAEDAAPGPPSKRAVTEAIAETAEALGNTATVTRNSYVHPAVLSAPMEAKPALAPRSGAPSRREELALLAVLRAEARRGGAVLQHGRKSGGGP